MCAIYPSISLNLCHHVAKRKQRIYAFILLKLTFVFAFFEILFMSLSTLCACEFTLKVTKHIIIIVCRRQHIASYMCIRHVFMRVFDATAASRAE